MKLEQEDSWIVERFEASPGNLLKSYLIWQNEKKKLELGMGMRRPASSASSRTYLHIWVVSLSCSTEPCDRKHSSHSLGPFIFQLQAQGRSNYLNFQSNMPRKRLVSQPGPGFLFVQANPGREWAVFQVSGQLWRILSSKCVCCYSVHAHTQKELLPSAFSTDPHS